MLHRPAQMLDELIIAGEMQESSKKSVLRAVSPASEPLPRRGCSSSSSSLTPTSPAQVGQADALEEQELSEDPLSRLSRP